MNWGLEIGVFICAIALTVLACTERDRPRSERRRVEPTAAEDTSSDEPALEPGSLAGIVRWAGQLPVADTLPVRVHADACGDEQPSRALRVSPRGGVADAVVSISGARPPSELLAQAPSMVIESCRFEPHVLATVVGATVVFRNADRILYNVHAYRGDDTVWDFALPEHDSTEQRTLDEVGALRIVCDVHSWMHAWVHAFDHPYFAVTDADGRFRIMDVPPGHYVVRVWHEGWNVVGTASGRPQYGRPVLLTRMASISSRQETSVDFELSEQAAELAGD